MNKIEIIASRLRDAYTQGAAAPLRDGLAPNGVEQAYNIQSIN